MWLQRISVLAGLESSVALETKPFVIIVGAHSDADDGRDLSVLKKLWWPHVFLGRRSLCFSSSPATVTLQWVWVREREGFRWVWVGG
ncbi:hypothetical protein TIFTF001_011805 [Ficus carica]|uniref:Uncharacterized protein n=1 Tax=Ficus carica TaxID=3494 RepID=A0AA88A0L6_FICCA|nr:hypothetical protein TIFTF001_011805 [Ficus carica]